MATPVIRYYAMLVYDANSKKTPKYQIVKEVGYYLPMDSLRGRDGKISFYLMEKLKEGANVPAMRLQAKGSINFTGLKDYFVDGKLSGYAYGYPYGERVFSRDNKPNPFYDYREDGYLFLISQELQKRGTPASIELIVLEGAKILAPAYCKQLLMGGFDDVLHTLRRQADKEDLL
jgi:hypothetical protein